MAIKKKTTTTKKSAPKGKSKKGGDFEPFPNSIAIFKNRDPKSDKSPTHTGRMTLAEDVIEAIRESDDETFTLSVSLWDKKSEAGNRYLSGAVSLPYEGGKGKDDDEEEEDEEEDFEEEEEEDDF